MVDHLIMIIAPFSSLDDVNDPKKKSMSSPLPSQPLVCGCFSLKFY
jgi:hypothetical protein